MTALLDAFQTTADDLAANRAGLLSERQAAEVRAATRGDAQFMVGFALVLAAVLYGILYVLVSNGRVFDFRGGVTLGHVVIVLVTAGLPTVSLAWAGYTWWAHARSKGVRAVQVVEGAVRLRRLQHRAAVLHELITDQGSFAISERAFAAFTDGERYRVYYVPVARVVVAAER